MSQDECLCFKGENLFEEGVNFKNLHDLILFCLYLNICNHIITTKNINLYSSLKSQTMEQY